MSKKTETTTVERRYCDICKTFIPRTVRDTNKYNCIDCGKDVCYRCRINLRRVVRFGKYDHADVNIGSMCITCCKLKKVETKPNLSNKRKLTEQLRKFNKILFGK